MVVRIAGLGYQKGFGGHFHNDNAVGVLRDIPGLVIASPVAARRRGGDAAHLPRAARVDGAVCVFLEPIALYHTRDLHEAGDGGWLRPTRGRRVGREHVPIGRARIYGDGARPDDRHFGNGLRMSLRVGRAARAAGRRRAGASTCVGSRRCRSTDILREARLTGRVLVVDETRRTGGVSEGVVAALVDAGFAGTDRAGDQRGQLHPAG